MKVLGNGEKRYCIVKYHGEIRIAFGSYLLSLSNAGLWDLLLK